MNKNKCDFIKMSFFRNNNNNNMNKENKITKQTNLKRQNKYINKKKKTC